MKLNRLNLIKKFKNFWFFVIATSKEFKERDVRVKWLQNIFYSENARHRFHLVSPSPWPLFASIAASSLLIGLLFWVHFIVTGGPFHHVFFLGFIIVSIAMFVWFRDVIREGIYMGYHTKIVQKGLKVGFILFLVSEIMFFFCLFWAYFHSSLNPSIWIGGIWPPEGIIHFYINDSFNTLFTTFYNSAIDSTLSHFHPASDDKVSGSVLSPLQYSEYMYFPMYDPTVCFDRIYLFYQNMFFYSPNGRIPLTYSSFFEKRIHEETLLFQLMLYEEPSLSNFVSFLKDSTFRVGSAFNYYYSEPLFSSVNISSRERYSADKYVFFMFFIKEILQESSVYISFLESGILDMAATQNFLNKKFNTIFLNLFYKFYQAPATINYWTLQNLLEKEMFLYPKTFACDSLIFNQRSFSGEPFTFGWPRYFYDSTPFNKYVKHGLNWYVYNNLVNSDKPSWDNYFSFLFKNYTFHFLDTFYDNSSISNSIGTNYENLLKQYAELADTNFFQKIMHAKNFFSFGVNSDYYEVKYMLENYDLFFLVDKAKRLGVSDLEISKNNIVQNNLLLMTDLNFFSGVYPDFNKNSMKDSVIKKTLALMFQKLARYDEDINLIVLFFSNKNYQIQLKHFYADVDLDSYNTAFKGITFFSKKELLLNLKASESKIFAFGNYFKFLNTLDNNFYAKYSFESDPIVVGAEIYNRVFEIFSYGSKLFNNYNFRWFLANINFNKDALPPLAESYPYDFLNKSYFNHAYSLPNLIVLTTGLLNDVGRCPIIFTEPAGIRFFFEFVDLCYIGRRHIDMWLNLFLYLFDSFWFTVTDDSLIKFLKNSKNLKTDGSDDTNFDYSDSIDLNYFETGNKDAWITLCSLTLQNYSSNYYTDFFDFSKKLNDHSSERSDLYLNFINNKIELYFKLYDIYMGGMSVYTGRFVEPSYKRFENTYFVLSVFDKGLLIDPNKVPWVNTLILITSGLAVTVSHLYFKANYHYFSLFFLALTIGLACFFLKIQMLEYIHASFSINDGIYGSVFYMLTGFHGFHVLIGTAFLGVCFFRILLRHFIAVRHIGFEFAIWYWHFVDVIWIGLYFFVYYWPNNYFFAEYHRIWQNLNYISTDGFSNYLCMLQYPIKTVSGYDLNIKDENFIPHLRYVEDYAKTRNATDCLVDYNRKLMSLCKYDRTLREALLSAIFINHSTTWHFSNWDSYFFGDRFVTKKCVRDYEMWWAWEDFGRVFRQEFKSYWRPWWFIFMEIFYTGRFKNPVIERRVSAPYWE